MCVCGGDDEAQAGRQPLQVIEALRGGGERAAPGNVRMVIRVWGGMVMCVVCMVAPILKDHLNTNASASFIAS